MAEKPGGSAYSAVPTAWLRLSVTVKEEASFSATARNRSLTITALPVE